LQVRSCWQPQFREESKTARISFKVLAGNSGNLAPNARPSRPNVIVEAHWRQATTSLDRRLLLVVALIGPEGANWIGWIRWRCWRAFEAGPASRQKMGIASKRKRRESSLFFLLLAQDARTEAA
jgi:hypothetical protein